MTPENKRTDMWWVIGTDVDVGKTTIASALVDILSEAGTVIGFKPRANYQYHKYIAETFQHGADPSKMICGDGFSLIKYSNLCSDDEIEVVVPFQMVSSAGFRQNYLTRFGSEAIGTRAFYAGTENKSLLRSPKIYGTGPQPFAFLPPGTLPVRPFNWLTAAAVSDACITKSYQYLMQKEPSSFVCEGAGAFLPIWAQQPVVNHIVLVDSFRITLFANCDLELRHEADELPMARRIAPQLEALSAQSKSAILPFAPPQHRHDAAKQTLGRLLERS